MKENEEDGKKTKGFDDHGDYDEDVEECPSLNGSDSYDDEK